MVRPLVEDARTSLRQFAGAGNKFIVSVSANEGQRFVLHWTRAISTEPIATMSHAPMLAAERVHAYPAASSSCILLRSLRLPLPFAFIGCPHVLPNAPNADHRT